MMKDDKDMQISSLERTAEFWRARCRELKGYLRRIEDTAVRTIGQGEDHGRALVYIEGLVHDALNSVRREVRNEHSAI